MRTDARRARRINSVDDAFDMARRRLPVSLLHGFENGAGHHATIRNNLEALAAIDFLPVGGVFHPERSLATTVLGHDLATPMILSAIGQLGVVHGDGEVGVARAAGAAGTIQLVSGYTSTPIEEIMAVASGPVYMQLYYFGPEQEAVVRTIERARAAGCAGLVFVIDSAAAQVPERARLYRQRRHRPTGLSVREAVRFAPQLVTKPEWTLDLFRRRVRIAAPMALRPDGSALSPHEAFVRGHVRTPQWSDLEWIREAWDCPVLVKGVMSADDARRAVAAGTSAIVVSNHGGNRLDGSIGTARVLPEVVDAVGDEVDVLVDGGIRNGTDVARMLALGARAVLLGRAYLYPFIAAGEPGVRRILEVLASELDGTLAHLGCRGVDELGPRHVATAW